MPSTFEAITERLDPACSYLIFVKASETGEETEFGRVMDILRKVDLPIRSTEFLVDDARGLLLLVVCLQSGRADELLQEVMQEGIPRDVQLYAYSSYEEA